MRASKYAHSIFNSKLLETTYKCILITYCYITITFIIIIIYHLSGGWLDLIRHFSLSIFYVAMFRQRLVLEPSEGSLTCLALELESLKDRERESWVSSASLSLSRWWGSFWIARLCTCDSRLQSHHSKREHQVNV